MSFSDILKDAANLPPHSAFFWHLMSVDAAGVAHEANVALSRLSATANAPVFSYLDNFWRLHHRRWPDAFNRGRERGGSGCRGSDTRWRKGRRHQDAFDPIRIAKVRLAANAAIWDQRERPAAWKHGSLQAALAMGNLPLANPGHVRRALVSRWSHHAPSGNGLADRPRGLSRLEGRLRRADLCALSGLHSVEVPAEWQASRPS